MYISFKIININKNRESNNFLTLNEENFPFSFEPQFFFFKVLSIKPWLVASTKAPLKANYFYK